MSEVTSFSYLFNESALEALASGATSFPKIDCEGQWLVKVIESTYGKNQAGTSNRTLVKVEIIANIGESADKVKARTNLYVNVGAKKEQTVRNLGPWIKTLIDLGITEDKFTYEATDDFDIIQNISTILTKQIKLGKEVVLKLVTKDDGKGGLYKNVYVYNKNEAPATPIADLPEAPTKTVKAPKVSKKLEATPEAISVNAMVESKIAQVVTEDDLSWMDND